MKSIFLLIPLLTSVSISKSAELSKTNEQYRLPININPTYYDLRLFIDPSNDDNFYGNVSIRILATESTNQVVLHADAIQIDSLRVIRDSNPVNNLVDEYEIVSDDRQLIIIKTAVELEVAVPYVIEIDYTAQFGNDLFGIYVSAYPDSNGITRKMATSMACPTYARRILPCFDEPALKAIFKTTIYTPAEFTTVLFNTIENNTDLWPDISGFVRHEFEETPVMSSYLLALTISAIGFVGNENNPIYPTLFKVYTRPGTEEHARWTLEHGQTTLLALEQYTEMEYPLAKMDYFAVPSFAFGAMENWGLVIYIETAILHIEGVTTTERFNYIGRVITHENVHQWFGNEVTPVWWDYIWLNEGFASFLDYLITDKILPTWRMMDHFLITTQGVLQVDASETVNAMTSEVFTPDEILANFDSITYQKAAAVLHMTQHFLTEEVFRKGVVYFLRNNARSTASASHLYNAFEQAIAEASITLPASIDQILDTWTTQAGFPVLNVQRLNSDGNILSLTQERFFSNRSLTSISTWYIPVNWVLPSNPDFENTAPAHWMDPTLTSSLEVNGLADADWFIFNVKETGYYRVNYDTQNWLALVSVLNSADFEVIHPLNRAQIMDDSFNLAMTQRISYHIFLGLSNYLSQELDYLPWAASSRGLRFLGSKLAGSETFYMFQKWIFGLTENCLQRLGVSSGQGEDHTTPFLRNIILDLSCGYGYTVCTKKAQEILQGFIEDQSQNIDPDIQTRVYCSSLRNGDTEEFNFLWNRYLNMSENDELSRIVSSLGCTSNEDSLSMLFNSIIVESSPIRNEDRAAILIATINSGPDNMDSAFEFVIENFYDLRDRLSASGIVRVFNALGSALTTDDHHRKLSALVSTNENTLSATELSAANSALTALLETRLWVEENMLEIDAWLRENVEASSVNNLFNTKLVFVCLALNFFLPNLL